MKWCWAARICGHVVPWPEHNERFNATMRFLEWRREPCLNGSKGLAFMLTAHQTLDGLSLFTTPKPALYQHDKHSHDCLSIIMITAGQKSYAIERQHKTVYQKQIAIANPGEVHGCESIDDVAWSHRTWYVEHTLLNSLAMELGLPVNVEITESVIDNAALNAYMVSAHEAAHVGNALERETAALQALQAIILAYGGKKKTSATSTRYTMDAARARVERAKALIHDCSAQSLRLSQLAKEAGVSRHQVIRDFQLVTHLTPGEYVRAVRLDRAKAMIANNVPLPAVAAQCGFADHAHLSRTFKRVYGITPLQFSRLVQGRASKQKL